MKDRVLQSIRQPRGWLVSLVLVAVSGCGGAATVHGTVRYQGRTVSYGSVIFLSADHTARTAVIQRDGSYSVPGIPPGEVKIGVISRDPSKARIGRRSKNPTEKRVQMETPGDWFPLPEKYESAETSGLTLSVGSGNVKHDIDLQ